MQIIHRQKHLECQMSCVLFREALANLQTLEQFAALHTFHNHVEHVLSLEDINKPDDIGMVYSQEDIDFGLQFLQLLFRQTFKLEALDCEAALLPLARRQVDIAIVAGTQDVFLDFIVIFQTFAVMMMTMVPAGQGNFSTLLLSTVGGFLESRAHWALARRSTGRSHAAHLTGSPRECELCNTGLAGRIEKSKDAKNPQVRTRILKQNGS
mmetsp:Transcript_57570/g.108496  ORF Transcript_57570/g.108496 Transcript_57570/m.108496 type:complete len:210 (+) Transcript_57570:1318-1947(+)